SGTPELRRGRILRDPLDRGRLRPPFQPAALPTDTRRPRLGAADVVPRGDTRPVAGDRALVLRPGEGRPLSLGSMELCFKVDDGETDGRYAVSIATVGGGEPGTTPHVHREHDDISFVVDGTIAF